MVLLELAVVVGLELVPILQDARELLFEAANLNLDILVVQGVQLFDFSSDQTTVRFDLVVVFVERTEDVVIGLLQKALPLLYAAHHVLPLLLPFLGVDEVRTGGLVIQLLATFDFGMPLRVRVRAYPSVGYDIADDFLRGQLPLTEQILQFDLFHLFHDGDLALVQGAVTSDRNQVSIVRGYFDLHHFSLMESCDW